MLFSVLAVARKHIMLFWIKKDLDHFFQLEINKKGQKKKNLPPQHSPLKCRDVCEMCVSVLVKV